MKTLLTDYLPHIRLGHPQTFRNVVMFPVFTTANGNENYLTLDDALGKKFVAVTEVGEGGQVPNLRIINTADIAVLLLEGEELIGAKQNRVLNTTVLLRPKSEMIIPVSCTEAGRWAYNSEGFHHSGHISPHKLRVLKSCSVAAALKQSLGHTSDQGMVWNEVAQFSSKHYVQSPSSALNDVVQARQKELDGYLTTLKPLPNQQGLLVLVNGRVAGFDVISSRQAYSSLHSKFVKSYAMHAMVEQEPVHGGDCQASARIFLEESKSCQGWSYPGIGGGTDHRFDGRGIAGFALEDERRVVHLNMFRG